MLCVSANAYFVTISMMISHEFAIDSMDMNLTMAAVTRRRGARSAAQSTTTTTLPTP
jgi:hypothetical protein